jgi:hypothetical protein
MSNMGEHYNDDNIHFDILEPRTQTIRGHKYRTFFDSNKVFCVVPHYFVYGTIIGYMLLASICFFVGAWWF